MMVRGDSSQEGNIHVIKQHAGHHASQAKLLATHLSAALCSSAAAPATSGQAIDVPSMGPYLHRAALHITAQHSQTAHQLGMHDGLQTHGASQRYDEQCRCSGSHQLLYVVLRICSPGDSRCTVELQQGQE